MCCVYAINEEKFSGEVSIRAIIYNLTKDYPLMLKPTFCGVPEPKEHMMWLSHWMLSVPFEPGDEVKFLVLMFPSGALEVKEVGIRLVYGEHED